MSILDSFHPPTLRWTKAHYSSVAVTDHCYAMHALIQTLIGQVGGSIDLKVTENVLVVNLQM